MKTSFKKNNCVAVIPFFNEEKFISEIINKTLVHVDKIILVNDGSTDNSLRNIPQSDRIILINLEKNFGKGFALNVGYKSSFLTDYECVITLDADLQHDPEYISDFIEKINEYDIVIGNRKKDLKKMPIQRIISNRLTSYLLTLKVKQKILDSQCGFRIYRKDCLKNILPTSKGFEAESEILVNAGRKNYQIGFTDIPTIYGEEKSKMKAFMAIKGFIKILFS